jgi:curved DNA-binding protein CbpA
MRKLNAARDTLKDPQKRAAYDRSMGIVRLPDGLRAEDV